MIIAVATDAHGGERGPAQGSQSIQDEQVRCPSTCLPCSRSDSESADKRLRSNVRARVADTLMASNAGLHIGGGTSFRSKGRITAGFAQREMQFSRAMPQQARHIHKTKE